MDVLARLRRLTNWREEFENWRLNRKWRDYFVDPETKAPRELLFIDPHLLTCKYMMDPGSEVEPVHAQTYTDGTIRFVKEGDLCMLQMSDASWMHVAEPQHLISEHDMETLRAARFRRAEHLLMHDPAFEEHRRISSRRMYFRRRMFQEGMGDQVKDSLDDIMSWRLVTLRDDIIYANLERWERRARYKRLYLAGDSSALVLPSREETDMSQEMLGAPLDYVEGQPFPWVVPVMHAEGAGVVIPRATEVLSDEVDGMLSGVKRARDDAIFDPTN